MISNDPGLDQRPPTDELPEIAKIEPTARVGEQRNPAAVIWFKNNTALRYVWDDDRDEIREQTYYDGVVHADLGVAGDRDDLTEYTLVSLAEYINVYKENPDACAEDWPHVYNLLTMQVDHR